MTTHEASAHFVFGRGTLRRFLAYLVLWLALTGLAGIDLVIGLAAAAGATWVSVLLLPVNGGRLSLAALARLVVRLLWQSLIAGIDVARRALDPRLPLRPGVITYSTGLAEGPARNAFRALTSLLPGTLAVSIAEAGDLLIHCLDTEQPVSAQLAKEEAHFVELVRPGINSSGRHE